MAVATTTTRTEFADPAAVSAEMEQAMSAPTTTNPARTRKVTAKEDTTPDVVTTDETKAKRVFTAVGRSGQPTTRSSATVMTHAVDVQRDGRANYVAGVVVRLFPSEEKAAVWAEAVNSGEGAKRDDWYETAKNAIVVPCVEVK